MTARRTLHMWFLHCVCIGGTVRKWRWFYWVAATYWAIGRRENLLKIKQTHFPVDADPSSWPECKNGITTVLKNSPVSAIKSTRRVMVIHILCPLTRRRPDRRHYANTYIETTHMCALLSCSGRGNCANDDNNNEEIKIIIVF